MKLNSYFFKVFQQHYEIIDYLVKYDKTKIDLLSHELFDFLLTENNLFPSNWNLNGNYHLKIEIIAEAIRNHVLVENTELYQHLMRLKA